jgi:hypothetical protein
MEAHKMQTKKHMQEDSTLELRQTQQLGQGQGTGTWPRLLTRLQQAGLVQQLRVLLHRSRVGAGLLLQNTGGARRRRPGSVWRRRYQLNSWMELSSSSSREGGRAHSRRPATQRQTAQLSRRITPQHSAAHQAATLPASPRSPPAP